MTPQSGSDAPEVLDVQEVPSDEVRIYPHKSFIMQEFVFYLEDVWLWRISGGYSQEMMGLMGEILLGG